MKSILRKIYHTPRKIRKKRLDKHAEVNPSPIFVLGNQKSGTSAIGALLAEATAQPATIDLEGLYEPIQTKLHKKEIPFQTFVNNNKYDFSKEIIKEPSLTFLYPEIKEHFNVKQNVFILRDPRDNLRSILNRVDIPGNAGNAEEEYNKQWKNINKNWMRVVDSRWLGLGGENYIEWMAHRWLKSLEIYEQYKEDFLLIKYEDFTKDKKGSIEKMAGELNLPVVNDISNKVDIQYQPAGNKKVNKKEFFGEENLARIERICAEKMKKYGYTPFQ
ncbi:Sulfotransferase domain-containing protein [Thalassobacillus cyri]|uniref:Sulfotransferase domain-containing protein n=1 Tax=Thalassobacillus cyri TaxID=571932 RepID=A0A1H4DWG6_9BACI|nr:sulfotransferase domain-containing protein [Thalassobacillus cyri]SEA76936.1 Sulfotransferase domain-containing protein [Thalassobacillus cyri]